MGRELEGHEITPSLWSPDMRFLAHLRKTVLKKKNSSLSVILKRLFKSIKTIQKV